MAGDRPIVLVCSDDESVGQALRFVLQLDGVDVRVCKDGPALLASPELAQSQFLVLQHCPPRLDGCALLGAARERGALAPAILLVSLLNAALQQRVGAAACKIFEWPVLDNRLVDAILGCLHGF